MGIGDPLILGDKKSPEIVVRRGGRVTESGGVQESCGCVTLGHGLMANAILS